MRKGTRPRSTESFFGSGYKESSKVFATVSSREAAEAEAVWESKTDT
jgi:hypothetical protein